MSSRPLDILDIIFQNRNKAYGAYVIRKSYNETLLKSVGATVMALILLIGGGFAAEYFGKHAKDVKKKKMIEVKMEAPPPPG